MIYTIYESKFQMLRLYIPHLGALGSLSRTKKRNHSDI